MHFCNKTKKKKNLKTTQYSDLLHTTTDHVDRQGLSTQEIGENMSGKSLLSYIVESNMLGIRK